MEQFSLSVLSNKTKHAVTMLPEVKNDVSITMTSSLELLLSNHSQDVDFIFEMDSHYPNVEIRQRFDNARCRFTQLSIPGFTVKHWIEHIVDVFCKNQGVALIFESIMRERFYELYEIIKNIKIVHLEPFSSQIQDYQRLTLFPSLEWLTVIGVDEAPIGTPILIQNFEGFIIFPNIQWKIDDVLISNFSNLRMWHRTFSVQDLNLFMRQWIKGSMPRLEEFDVILSHSNQHKLVETDLFKSIKYTVKENENCKINVIKRRDGAKASVCFGGKSSYEFHFTVESEPD